MMQAVSLKTLTVLLVFPAVILIGCEKIKVCKIAGPGVEANAPFQYETKSESLTVIAGSEPSGQCQVVKKNYRNGVIEHIQEVNSPNTYVTDIQVAPASRLISRSLFDKKVEIKVGKGVTEVTFTNTTRKTGYLEICKVGGGLETYKFRLSEGDHGIISVRGDSCSSALVVPTGTLLIKELPHATSQFSGCAIFPRSRPIDCDHSSGTAKVQIISGDISEQTIVFMKNEGPVEQSREE